MKAQVLLTPAGAKHLIAKALCEYVDFTKRVYIAYGTTNEYLLYHLGIERKISYVAGCNVKGKLNVTVRRDKPVILENMSEKNIADFEIGADDYFIKGANALWYENGEKHAAVAAADKNGGTYGNFYIKAACRGSRIIIAVGHEKLIPFFKETSQDVDFSNGVKISMLRYFQGEVFTEIEAFKILFNVRADVICAGGVWGSEGSVGFLVEGERVSQALDFCNKYNFLKIEKETEFIFQ